MKPFKQILGSLPRHLPSNAASRTCPADQTLRNGHRYFQTNIPRYLRPESSFAKNGRAYCHRLNDEDLQVFLYERPKLALFHNRNSSMDRTGNLDISFQENSMSSDYENMKINKKTFKTYAYKNAKLPPHLSTSPAKPRSYAQMIADYSEAFEKEAKSQLGKRKESPKRLLPRLPFDSVVSSFTKFERTRLGSKPRMKSASSLPMSGRKSRGSNHTLTNNNEKRKMSPKKDGQKREYFTKNVERLKKYRVEKERNEWLKNIQESGEKRSEEKPESQLAVQRDFDVVCNNFVIEKEKENFAEKWIKPTRVNSVNVAVNDSTERKMNALENNVAEKFNVLALDDKIEIQIPVNVQITKSGNDIESKISVLSLRISAKLQDRRLNIKSLHTHTVSQSRMQSPKTNPILPQVCKESDDGEKKKLKICNPPDKTPKHLKSKALPWWASDDCTPEKEPKDEKKPDACLNEVYNTSPAAVEVLASEKLSDDKTMKQVGKLKPKSAVKQGVQQQQQRAASAESLKPRRRRKMTNIAKITRHIEEEIREKKKEAKKAVVEEVKKPEDNEAAKLEKVEKQASEVVSKADDKQDVKKQDPPKKSATGQDKSSDDKGRKSAASVDKKKGDPKKAADGKNEKPKSAKSGNKNAGFSISAFFKPEKIAVNAKNSFKDTKLPKPNIAVLEKSIKEMEKNKPKEAEKVASAKSAILTDFDKVAPMKETEKNKPKEAEKVASEKSTIFGSDFDKSAPRRNGLIDYGLLVKKIPDQLKPIEKKDDGTIIDYGLTVPTRKRKVKKPDEKLRNVPENVPKKTTSAPEQKQEQPKDVLNQVRIHSPEPGMDKILEVPVNKDALSKQKLDVNEKMKKKISEVSVNKDTLSKQKLDIKEKVKEKISKESVNKDAVIKQKLATRRKVKKIPEVPVNKDSLAKLKLTIKEKLKERLSEASANKDALSKQKSEIKEKMKENVAIAADKEQRKPEGGGSTGSTSGSKKSGDGTSTPRKGGGTVKSSALEDVDYIDTLPNTKSNTWNRILLPHSRNKLDVRESRFGNDKTESKLKFEVERPEKELIYSAWLNRFHTRQHKIVTK